MSDQKRGFAEWLGSLVGSSVRVLRDGLLSPQFRYLTAIGIFLICTAIGVFGIRTYQSLTAEDAPPPESSTTQEDSSSTRAEDWEGAAYRSKASRSSLPWYANTQTVADAFSDPATWPDKSISLLPADIRDTINTSERTTVQVGTYPIYTDETIGTDKAVTLAKFKEGWELYISSTLINGQWTITDMEYMQWK